MKNNNIKVQYASPGLYERIVQGLEAIGKSPAFVDLGDLYNLKSGRMNQVVAPAPLRSSPKS